MNSQRTSSTPTRSPARSFFSPSQRSLTSNSTTIPQSPSKKQQQKQINEANRYMNYNPEKEPIKAFLRIRPKPENYQSIEEPYIEIIDDVEVSMTPPENSNAYRTRHRAPERYRFTKVFQDSTDQQTFFNETALDLVQDVLYGNNALIFAYGVTNSGKTFSVMGKEYQNNAGLLPRSLNIIFNSIQEYESETKIKPVMHSLVQAYDSDTEENRQILNLCNTQESTQPVYDTNSIDIDPNYEYGVWVSFVEVYNEQVYDLLDTKTKPGMKRTQLHLKYEQKSGNKYVADMNIVKVKSIEEANAIMKLGQQNRQVFSTLMNQTSSRSHSIFTVHVVRCLIDEDNFVIEDPKYATVSKLSIVDLAGSERYKNTNSTGQRLKEAGNINKSLMVLGQCMEVLRVNQIKTEMGKNPSIVPFRHSKLTELFKSTFEGDGKAVIIVNVNPFDTGFDENSHVMKFAAVAKDVTTWRQIQPKFDLQQIETHAKRLRNGMKEATPVSFNINIHDEVEEEEDKDDHFVDSLIAQLDDLNNKWIDAEMRAANVESDIRQQLSKETDNQLKKMEEIYLLALNKKNAMEDESQLGDMNNDQNFNTSEDNPFLTMLHQRQQSMADEINSLSLNMRIQDFDTTKQSMLDKISELEKENQKEREKSEYLLTELQKQKELSTSKSSSLSTKNPIMDHHTEDEGDDDMLKENDDPKAEEFFNNFLSLRKQLRRSIFKREELCKDADAIMNKVEQIDGVTFELVKETKMGKLLKLIAQEEFEKDPYQIRNRAVKLFKRYAQLPTASTSTTSSSKMAIDSPMALDQATPQPPRKAFSFMTLNSEGKYNLDSEKVQVESAPLELTDIESLRAENAKLKLRLRSLNKGQKRLKEAFDKTRALHHNHVQEDTFMIVDNSAIKSNDSIVLDEQGVRKNEDNAYHSQPPQINPLDTELNSDDSPIARITTDHEKDIQEQDNNLDDEYESDINELLKQKKRHKRRRKLRSH